MKKLNRAYVAAIRRTVTPCPCFDLLSMKIEGLKWG
jgi:hypothetical protein